MVHEGIEDHKCDYCEKSFSDAGHLKKHVKTVHKRIKDQNCDHCGKSFTDSGSLKLHVEGVHEGVKYKCNNCEKSTMRVRIRVWYPVFIIKRLPHIK